LKLKSENTDAMITAFGALSHVMVFLDAQRLRCNATTFSRLRSNEWVRFDLCTLLW